jgi:hypothetical protein
LFSSLQVSVCVSLGTGLIPVTELKQIDVFRPDSIWDTAKLAYGISAIGKDRYLPNQSAEYQVDESSNKHLSLVF